MLASFGYILWQAQRSMYNLKVHSQPLQRIFRTSQWHNWHGCVQALLQYGAVLATPRYDQLNRSYFPSILWIFSCKWPDVSMLLYTFRHKHNKNLWYFNILLCVKIKVCSKTCSGKKKKKGKNQIEVEGCMSNLFCFILQSLAAKTVMKKMAQRICIYNP